MELHEIDSLKLTPEHLRKVVVLTGAGISAESGVPTFRGAGGLWRQYKPEELATPEAFAANPRLVWEWYLWRRQLIAQADLNPGHFALVALENLLKDDFTLITQNVDGLHRQAGSRNPIELHGNIFVNRCSNCSDRFPDDALNFDNLPPVCPRCQGEIRPDVVWFGESLNPVNIEDAFTKSRQATLFLSIGTSAMVHPAASLPMLAKESVALLIEINPDSTPLTPMADFAIRSSSAEALPPLVEKIRRLRFGDS
jgi:NAD-dependent deacetylase